MTDEEPQSRLEREIAAILRAMDADSPHESAWRQPYLSRWADRTRDQRFAQKALSHGNPLGLAKSTLATRERLVAELREYVANLDTAEAAEYAATHEALAWALDAERFLGNFQRGTTGGLRPGDVDEVTDHLLVWLAERACTVVRDVSAPVVSDDAPPVDLVLSLDPVSGMVLDGRSARHYERLDAEDVGFEEPLPDTDAETEVELNMIAAAWCQGLQLSERQWPEGPPPSGSAGQYGRHGCVLLETAANPTTIVRDVCLFPYDDAQLDRFLAELGASARVDLVAAPVSVRDVAERINGLHPLSRYAHQSTLDRDLSQMTGRTDIEAALTWGRQHAARLIDER